jgi:hypothetical protein
MSAAGKIQRYERRVVDVAIARTTENASAALPLCNISTAAIMNTEETTPERTLQRTGVPSFLLNTPNHGKNAPSYAATARTRSAPIIHTAPEVISVKMNPSAVSANRNPWAPP